MQSPKETFELGHKFSGKISSGNVLIFKGDLGAGKTTCIKGVCAGLGVTQPVTSPTFTLINEYQGRLPVYHFDFYRIRSEIETLDLGLQEYFEGDGVCLIEWPEVIVDKLPTKRYEFHMNWDPAFPMESRHVVIYSSEN